MAKNTQITVGELYNGVTDGRIISDIELQREIVYDRDKQELVIDSILNGVPLPAFYFWENENGQLEVLDGKQRIEAIKNFRQNDLQYRDKNWKQLPEIQEQFNNVVLSVIICSGEETLKREIFRRINTLGIALSPFEVINGLYHGRYIEELTDYSNLPSICNLFGSNSRGRNQMHILKWLLILDGEKATNESISEYVKSQQGNSFMYDQNRLRAYIKFISSIFTDFGLCDLYFLLSIKYLKDVSIWKAHRDAINKSIKDFKKSDAWKLIPDKAKEIEERIQAIVGGISVDPKRLFTPDDKAELLTKLTAIDGKYECNRCKQHFYPDELTIDHVQPWSKGGRTVLSNAQLLCRACNSSKGNKG